MDSRHFNNRQLLQQFLDIEWPWVKVWRSCHMPNNKQFQDFYINWIFPVIDCLWTCRKLRQFSEKWLFWKWNYFEDESGLVSSAHWENTVHLPDILRLCCRVVGLVSETFGVYHFKRQAFQANTACPCLDMTYCWPDTCMILVHIIV